MAKTKQSAPPAVPVSTYSFGLKPHQLAEVISVLRQAEATVRSGGELSGDEARTTREGVRLLLEISSSGFSDGSEEGYKVAVTSEMTALDLLSSLYLGKNHDKQKVRPRKVIAESFVFLIGVLNGKNRTTDADVELAMTACGKLLN